jgi:hypothetical protein
MGNLGDAVIFDRLKEECGDFELIIKRVTWLYMTPVRTGPRSVFLGIKLRTLINQPQRIELIRSKWNLMY